MGNKMVNIGYVCVYVLLHRRRRRGKKGGNQKQDMTNKYKTRKSEPRTR